MTIELDRATWKYKVMLGCLIYAEFDSRHDAEITVREYYRSLKAGRA